MSFLEIFALFASSATIFGLIVGVFSVYNGRATRRDITALIRETQQLIHETHRETLAVIQEIRELIAREEAATRQLIQQELAATRQLVQENQVSTREILLRITEILARIDERVR